MSSYMAGGQALHIHYVAYGCGCCLGSAAQLADCVHKLQRWRGQHGLGSRGGAHGDARLHAHTRTLRLCWPASNTQRPPPACASQQSNAAAACCCARIPRTAPASRLERWRLARLQWVDGWLGRMGERRLRRQQQAAAAAAAAEAARAAYAAAGLCRSIGGPVPTCSSSISSHSASSSCCSAIGMC